MPLNPEMRGSFNQFPVNKNIASWRQEEINLSGNALRTMYFADTTPNMFYLQNPNDVPLLVGITRTPTETSYEYRVEPNTSRTFGRPIPTSNLYILNPSNKAVTISLFSVNDVFDISILQSQSLNVSDIEGMAYDGIIKGFSSGVSLPSGTNTLGKVVISEAIPKGSNNIGIVSLTNEVTGFISGIHDLLNEVKTGVIESNKKLVDFLFYERENVSASVSIDFNNEPFLPNYINFISNDDDTDILVTITFVNGSSKMFTLAHGDIFGDIKADIVGITVAPKNDTSAISWRIMCGLRG